MIGISVLIPVYQHNPSVLILELHKQLSATSIPFEIQVLDDASNVNYFSDWSSSLHTLSNCTINRLDENQGRSGIRNLLVQEAKYNWLLFLDADTSLCSDSYIQQFLPFLSDSYDAVCGGTAYRKTLNDSTHSLRWKYGKAREEKSAALRNMCPFKNFTLNNLLIQKDCLLKFPLDISIRDYGHEDTVLGMVLEQHKIRIKHIDNFVFHDGLDTNDVFLSKIIQSVHTLVDLYRKRKLTEDTNLIQHYKKLHLLKMDALFFFLLKPFIPLFNKNLTGKNPSLFLLDLLKLWHFINKIRS